MKKKKTIAAVHVMKIYCCDGVTFRWHPVHGPQRCNKNGELTVNADNKAFRKAMEHWNSMTPEQRESLRVYE